MLAGDFDGLILQVALAGRACVTGMPTPGTCAPAPANRGTISCNGRWPRAGRGWKTCR